MPSYKHDSGINLIPPPFPLRWGSKIKCLNLAITNECQLSFFYGNFVCGQRNNRYKTYQTGFKFEGLGQIPWVDLVVVAEAKIRIFSKSSKYVAYQIKGNGA